jgi:hypothetical protein
MSSSRLDAKAMTPYDKAKILLIDSVHSELMVGIIKNGIPTFETNMEQRTHDRNVNLITRFMLLKNDIKSFSDFDAYAVMAGPGSWTGCRVGVTAIKGYASAYDRPVSVLNSLDIIENADVASETAKDGRAVSRSDIAVLRSNLDNYYVKRDGKYGCEKLSDLSGFKTLEDVGVKNYMVSLVSILRAKYEWGEYSRARDVMPIYITNFEVKK